MKRVSSILSYLGIIYGISALLVSLFLTIFFFLARNGNSDLLGPDSKTLLVVWGCVFLVYTILSFFSLILSFVGKTIALNRPDSPSGYHWLLASGIFGISPFFILAGIFGAKSLSKSKKR